MNKFCFTQSESNKSYCKTQSSIIYIPLLIFLILIVSISSVNSYILGGEEKSSPIAISTSLLLDLKKKKKKIVFLSVSGSNF